MFDQEFTNGFNSMSFSYFILGHNRKIISHGLLFLFYFFSFYSFRSKFGFDKRSQIVHCLESFVCPKNINWKLYSSQLCWNEIFRIYLHSLIKCCWLNQRNQFGKFSTFPDICSWAIIYWSYTFIAGGVIIIKLVDSIFTSRKELILNCKRMWKI